MIPASNAKNAPAITATSNPKPIKLIVITMNSMKRVPAQKVPLVAEFPAWRNPSKVVIFVQFIELMVSV